LSSRTKPISTRHKQTPQSIAYNWISLKRHQENNHYNAAHKNSHKIARYTNTVIIYLGKYAHTTNGLTIQTTFTTRATHRTYNIMEHTNVSNDRTQIRSHTHELATVDKLAKNRTSCTPNSDKQFTNTTTHNLQYTHVHQHDD
jgi:hypothetical protein